MGVQYVHFIISSASSLVIPSSSSVLPNKNGSTTNLLYAALQRKGHLKYRNRNSEIILHLCNYYIHCGIDSLFRYIFIIPEMLLAYNSNGTRRQFLSFLRHATSSGTQSSLMSLIICFTAWFLI